MNACRPCAIPSIKVIGEIGHADFANAVALLRSTAAWLIDPSRAPEVVIVFNSRPASVAPQEIERRQRCWPLASFVVVAGSWCEGELRTGWPTKGVRRFYWHEFPGWWRQQLRLHRDGRCPEWARPIQDIYRVPTAVALTKPFPNDPLRAGRHWRHGVVVIHAADRYMSEAIADVLHDAGFATIWQPPGRPAPVTRGAVAAIWDGGQLSDKEEDDLAMFCRARRHDATPVIALLDFPRRERCDVAIQLGAAAVMGKPWFNRDLVSRIRQLASCNAARDRRAA